MGSVRDEIAKNLLYYRKKKKLSQKQFAEILKVNNSAVSNWEHGTNSIDIDTLHSACSVLGVSMNDMFGVYANAKPEQYKKKEKRLIDDFRSLNDEGQTKIIDNVDDLIRSGKYIKNNTVGLDYEKQA